MSGMTGFCFKRKPEIYFIPQASVEEQEAFLSQPGFFTCETQKCIMKESECVKNQKISRESTKPGKRELHRDFCIGCKQGEKIARQHKVSLKTKAPKKCPKCGKVVTEKYSNSYTCTDCRREMDNKRTEGLAPYQVLEALV